MEHVKDPTKKALLLGGLENPFNKRQQVEFQEAFAGLKINVLELPFRYKNSVKLFHGKIRNREDTTPIRQLRFRFEPLIAPL